MPKVELHRHLGGSLRISSLLELVDGGEVVLEGGGEGLLERIQVCADDPKTPETFLKKFVVLRAFMHSPELIRRLTREVVEDAAAENVRYLELHFTPFSFAQPYGFRLRDVFEWVTESVAETAMANDIRVSLIASINRRESVEDAEAVVQLACDHLEKGIVGLGLSGDERAYPADSFLPLFKIARQAGLGITVHAGEWMDSQSVRYALEAIEADRIGHGIHVLDDPDLVAMARERRVVFEVCPTSNIHTGVVASMHEHPLAQMIASGLLVTINSDDPSVLDIRLTDEYLRVVRDLDISMETIKGTILTAIQAAFLPAREKEALETDFIHRLFQRNSRG
ncbi:MAG TPA: adenosine deaminase [Anaerolineae bacterium]|nr:adenosine deaminase [Anaerolineae bacterium]